MPKLSYPVKVSLVGTSLGVALIVALASYFRRRKKRRPYREIRSITNVPPERPKSRNRGQSPAYGRSPNGEIPNSARNSSVSSLQCQFSNSTASVNTIGSVSSVNTLTFSQQVDTTNMTSEQLCELGIESLKHAIEHWEVAIEKLADREEVADANMDHLSQHIRQLIDRARRVQEIYEEKIFSTVSTNVAVDSAITTLTELDRAYNERRASIASLDGESSDLDSFVSATDMADLSDLEDHLEHYQHLALYEAALLELEHGSIPFRTLRTNMVKCNSDTEFLAKLHCIRIALEDLFKDQTIRNWFAESGKQMLGDLLIKAERDPEEFDIAFDDMMQYISEESTWPIMEEELRGRGVKVLSFYDIVIDFILFDAFDDLENPPSSVTTVVQNRWLSNGFKETALATAVWSVLKAKRRLLKVPKGFISHFYSISEHISPVLAWGFLGPESELKDLCRFFKEQVLSFMQDVFSFTKVRYTTVEQLSDDILRLSKERILGISARLSS